jgi:hypothetical protein
MAPPSVTMESVAEVSGGAPRRTDRSGAGLGRVLSAVAITVVVTAAVTVPMAYQARSARDSGPAPSVVTEPTVPAQVAGITLTRDQLVDEPARIAVLEPADDVRVSTDGVAGEARALDGAQLPIDDVWIIVPRPDAEVVRFWLNDASGSGPPDQVDQQVPFTLVSGPDDGAPAALDTAALPTGPNTILVEITSGDGTVKYQIASFRVG